MNIMLSLRVRLLLIMGMLTTILLLIIAFSVFYQWRAQMVEKEGRSAVLITEAFSISILDAMIYRENKMLQSEDFFDNHFKNFRQKNKHIKYVAVLDKNNKLLAHSELSLSKLPEAFTESKIDIAGYRISNEDSYGWIIEVIQPLRISQKQWGILILAFDADPLRQSIQRLFFIFLTLTISGIIIILIVLYIISGQLTRSLSKLVKEIKVFDLDNIRPSALPKSNDEIGILVESFETMKERLAHSQEQIITAQRQVYQAEKLASIGRLASGVAHEINNPLNGIKSCIYAINKNPDNQKQAQQYLQLIDEGITHIETIVKKLLGFARKPAESMESVNINEAITKALKLMDFRLTQKHIETTVHLDSTLPAIKADGNLIQEVIMNLLLNSYDAMPEDGQLSITSEFSKHRVEICIKDNGSGISDKNQKKIFDPFFTTKDPGEGTGLGLAVSLSIVEAHNGSLEIESKEGEGTEVIIQLPESGSRRQESKAS